MAGRKPFQRAQADGGLVVTTAYHPARRGSRAVERTTVAREPLGLGQLGGGVLTPAHRAVLEQAWRASRRGTVRLEEERLRARLASARPVREAGLLPADLLDDLVRWGIFCRRETLLPSGEARRSYLALTPMGEEFLLGLFGPLEENHLERLAAWLASLLAACRRQEVKVFLARQLAEARMGNYPVLDLGDGGSCSYSPREDSRRYEKIVSFLGLLGSLAPGESVEFKEAAGRLFPGERDSVKLLEGVRPAIAAAAENELGRSLEELGVLGAHVLYWLPLHGLVTPRGSQTLWGTAPALSTRDIRRTAAFETPARRILLVENRSVLDLLAEDNLAAGGYLVLCTEGSPKRALYAFLERLQAPGGAEAVIWTDWDVGGLNIAANLLRDLSFPRLSLVGHPGLPGQPVSVPARLLEHPDQRLRLLAHQVEERGAVYQEMVLSSYRACLEEKNLIG